MYPRKSKKVSKGFDEKELKKTLDEIFDKYDKNKDEALSKQETHMMMKELMARKNQTMTDKELDNLIYNMFDKADKDKNGSLDREEFYKFYKMM